MYGVNITADHDTRPTAVVEEGVAVWLARAAGDLLDEGGTAAVTMRAVGARAGVSAMAIYRHYPSREALLHRLADAAFDKLGRRFESSAGGDVDAALRVMLDHLLDLALSRPHLYALMFIDRRESARTLPDRADESPKTALTASKRPTRWDAASAAPRGRSSPPP